MRKEIKSEIPQSEEERKKLDGMYEVRACVRAGRAFVCMRA